MRVASKLTGLTMLAIATASVWFAFQTQDNAGRVFVETPSITQAR